MMAFVDAKCDKFLEELDYTEIGDFINFEDCKECYGNHFSTCMQDGASCNSN